MLAGEGLCRVPGNDMIMELWIILYGVSTFLLCLAAHAALWRVRLPHHRALALFFIFFLLPLLVGSAAALASFAGLAPFTGPGPFMPLFHHADGLAAVLLLHYALSSAYILSYPAVEAISPTLAIALLMGDSGRALKEKELARCFPDESLLAPRIMDLVKSRLVRLDNGILSLTWRGRALVLFFTALRSFMGLRPGKG
jgi:hypothetical protein